MHSGGIIILKSILQLQSTLWILMLPCSVTQSCLTLCDLTDCSMPGFPVLHYFLEFAQTHVHWVSDAIQPSCPLSHPSPPAFNLSQHQGLSQWVGSLHQVDKLLGVSASASVLPMNIRVDFLYDWLVWSPFNPRDLRESSPEPQFESINSSLLSLLCGPTLTSICDYWKNCSFDYMDLCQQSNVSFVNLNSRFVFSYTAS